MPFKYVNRFLASEAFARQKKILDFDVSNLPISELWVTLLKTGFFFTELLSNIIFFSQNQSKDIFSTPPPQEYQMDHA